MDTFFTKVFPHTVDWRQAPEFESDNGVWKPIEGQIVTDAMAEKRQRHKQHFTPDQLQPGVHVVYRLQPKIASPPWMRLEEASKKLGVGFKALRDKLGRRAQTLEDGRKVCELPGIQAEKFGKVWKVKLK